MHSNQFAIHVNKAITLFDEIDSKQNDEELFVMLTALEIPEYYAKEMLIFLPIVFVRCLLPQVKWHDTFFEIDANKKEVERKYTEVMAFNIILEETKNYFASNPKPETIIKIAGRSAEFHCINEILLQEPNCEIESIELTKAYLL